MSRAFVLAFCANTLHGLGFWAYLHLPGYLSGLGAEEFLVGIVVGIMAAAAIASRPLIGWLMDRRGRHVVVWIGSVLHVGVTLMYLSVDSIGPLLFVIRIVHGVAEGMLFASLFTIAADVVPAARRTEGIALFGISGMLPMALASLLGDMLLSWGDYDTLFIVSSGMALVGGLCGVPLRDSRPAAEEGADPPPSFLTTVSRAQLRPLWLMGLAFSIAIASFLTFFKIYVETTGIGSMGLFFSLYSAAAIVLRIMLGWVPDRLGPRLTLGPALGCLVVGLVVLAQATGNGGIALAGILCGTGHAFTFPILSALVVSRAQAQERGTALSVFTALFDLGLLMGAPAFGAVLEHSDFPTMYFSAAVLLVVGGVAYAVWDRRVAPPVSRPSPS